MQDGLVSADGVADCRIERSSLRSEAHGTCAARRDQGDRLLRRLLGRTVFSRARRWGEGQAVNVTALVLLSFELGETFRQIALRRRFVRIPRSRKPAILATSQDFTHAWPAQSLPSSKSLPLDLLAAWST
jgi:hypothetical protein